MSLQPPVCRISLMLGGMKTLTLISILYIYVTCVVDGSNRARETAQSIQCILYKYEDLSLIPGTHGFLEARSSDTCL